jgi:hypothetical protein
LKPYTEPIQPVGAGAVDVAALAGAEPVHEPGRDVGGDVARARGRRLAAARRPAEEALVGARPHDAVGVHGDGERSRERAHHLAVRRDRRVGAVPAEAGVLRVDQVGLHRPQRVVVDLEPLARLGEEARDEHVGSGEQLVEDGEALGLADVERHAPLVLVHLEVGGAVVRCDLAQHVAQVVAAAG